MFNRLKILTLLQLGNRQKISTISNKKKFFLNIFLLTLLAFAISGVLYFVLNYIKNNLFLPVNKGMLTFILFITQIISIIATSYSLMNSLYKSKDNPILLSYPAKPNEVFLSKLIVEYLREIKKSLFFLLPLLIAFGIVSSGGILYFVFSVILFFVLPIFPVFIGALLSIPLVYIKKVLDKVPFIYLILLVVFVVLLFFGIQAFVDKIPKPLRIIALYTKFVNGLTSFIVSANVYAMYYTFITNILYSINPLLNLLWIILIVAGIVVATYYTSMPLYFKMALSHTEVNKNKVKTVSKSKHNSVFYAFFKKELLFTIRNINLVISNYLLIFFMPILLYVMNVVFSAIITSDLGDSMIIAFNFIVASILVLCSNTQSASAITMEGGEIALLKTAPSNTMKMVWAKLLVNTVVSTFLILLNSIILSASNLLSPLIVWGMFAILLFLNWGHILWSFQLDVIKPKLREYAQSERLDSNSNISFSMTLALIISFVYGFISLFLLVDDYNTAWIKIIAIAFAFFALRVYFFIQNLSVYFKRIEY